MTCRCRHNLTFWLEHRGNTMEQWRRSFAVRLQGKTKLCVDGRMRCAQLSVLLARSDEEREMFRELDAATPMHVRVSAPPTVCARSMGIK